MSAETLPSGLDPLSQLVAEANRQLDICNACRYCEGYCAVFPALERRTLLGDGDVTQLANLCHDCRACYDACMYAPPHAFDINIPKVLSAVRAESYGRYAWPRRVPSALRGARGVVLGLACALAVMLAIALASAGPRRLVASAGGARSPYEIVPYPAILTLFLLVAAFALFAMGASARSYWKDVGGSGDHVTLPALINALKYALSLRYLRGGGGQCFYPDDEVPSPARKRLHHFVFYGFLACVLSTASAGVLQDFLGSSPPYPVVSVPVLSGSIGGLSMIVGCTGLLLLKRRSSAITSVAAMTVKDYGLLVALTYLAITGMLTLLLRATPAFGIVYLMHLSAILLCFLAAPYSKFVHLVYRVLAIVKDNLEMPTTR